MKRLLAAIVVLVGLGSLGALYLRQALYGDRYKGFTEPVFVEIPKGKSTQAIGEMLAENGVLRSAWQLRAMRALHPFTGIQAGDYQFAKPATPAEIFDRLRRGDIYTVEFRVPEGANLWDVADIAEQTGLVKRVDFLAVAGKPDLIVDLDPSAPNLEGYLFPSTYRFRRKVTALDICRTMTQQFRKTWKSLGVGADVHKAVVLASLVEKEAKLPEERPRIAGVYVNRLERGIKLDCDPTVIYAALLVDKWKGTIHRSDLDRDHPYNTYLKTGLPPGPIASPGLKSLEAAVEPAKTDEIFFVARADGSGGHTFSATAAAHNKAVEAYRSGLQTHANPGVARKPVLR